MEKEAETMEHENKKKHENKEELNQTACYR